MIEQHVLYLGEIFVMRFSSAVRKATQPQQALIYFHGFPGPVPGNPNKPLDHQLAEAVSELGIDVIAPYYRGILQSRGKYHFSGTLEDGRDVLAWTLAQGYDSVSILGYSWGAQVGIPAFLSMPKDLRSKLILMSPAIFIPEGETLEGIVKGWRDSLPWLLEHVSDAEIVTDLLSILERNPMDKISKELDPHNLHIVQALDDEVIPQKATDSFASLLNSPSATYVKMAGGHSFIDRVSLQKEIRNIFTNN